MFTLSAINRRLLPLYAGAFLQGLVFWYAIEKLFMRGLGYNDAQIGIIIAGMTVAILLLEVPSGILSDRWSRKGTLAIGFFALGVNSLIAGLSQNMWHYAISVIPWGVYSAMVSGVYESIIYDTLEEEGHSTEQYEKYFGRVDIVASIGLIAGSLISSPIAEIWGQRATFYATVPAAILAVAATLYFREPSHHKISQESELLKHIKQTLREVIRKPELYWLLIGLFSTAVASSLLFEFGQVWWIPLGLSIGLFGPFNAVILSTIGVAGAISQLFKSKPKAIAVSAVVVLSAALLTIDSLPIIIIAQFTTLTGLLVLDLLLNKQLQDSLSSSVRAGANSVASTLSSLFIIPSLIIFGFLSDRYSVFSAAYFLLVITALVGLALLLNKQNFTKTTI